MESDFPAAVPEIPVSDINRSTAYTTRAIWLQH